MLISKNRELKIAEGNVRRLGYWETLNALVHEIHGHGTIATLTKVNKRIDPQNLLKAMHAVFTKHPLLRGTLNRDKEGFYTVTTNAFFNNIDYSVIEANDENVAEQIYQDHLYQPFDIKKSLWRVTLFLPTNKEICYLICTFSHAIGDGASAANVVKELLHFLNEMQINKFSLPESLPFLLPVEAMIDKSKFEIESKKILSQGEVTLTEGIKQSTWPFQNTDPGLSIRKTGNILCELNSIIYQQLLNACNSHNVSINDALNSALLLSLQQISSKELITNLCTPISLRKYCKPEMPNDFFGCYVTMVLTQHTIYKNDDFWAIAKDYHQKISASIIQAGHYPEQYSINDVMPYSKQCLKKRKTFFMDFGISNLGKLKDFNFPENSFYKPESFYFCASRQAADFAGLLCVSSFINKIFIDFGYTKPVMNDDFIMTIKNLFIKNIQNAIKNVNHESKI